MTILDVNRVSKSYGPVAVLDDISFKVEKGEKLGIVGENGGGKSTLLKMIAGLEPVTSGVIASPRDVRVGYLSQHLEFEPGTTIRQEVMKAFTGLRDVQDRLRRAESAMAEPGVANDPTALDRAMNRYSRLQTEFEQAGGYAMESRADAVIHGLGLDGREEHVLDTLSGGEKNIVALARILLEEPDILLLDEPANHLDFEGLAWLEEFIAGYDRTVILVSHNRYLLDRTVTRIVEIQDRRVTAYLGNYSAYRAEKMRALLKQKQEYQDQQKEIRRLEEMIKRFEHWAHITVNKRAAVQARNKQKYLDRMEKVDRPDLDRGRIDPRFDGSAQGHIALDVKGYTKAFGDRVLFDEAETFLAYGDRVGLIGANGTGKSTLFKDIVETAAWGNRSLRIGPRTKLGYYAQEHQTLNFNRSMLEEVMSAGNMSKDAAFTVLNRFLFRWEDMDRRIGDLSGGEKSRVQFACLMVRDINFLLLDEPTNHLDIQSRERVEEALEEFEGTILVISHDRYFLDRIVDRIVEIQTPGLVDFPGNFSAWWSNRRSRGAEPSGGAAAPGSKDAEEEIDRLESEKLAFERKLGDAYRRNDYRGGERISRQLKLIESQIEALFEKL